MFEKEAEDNKPPYAFCTLDTNCELWKDGFQKGAEFGYNKANENECKLLKSLLYCTVKSCNNCGKVNCENFQRQRIDCCSLWVSYKDYIAKLEKENAELKTKKIPQLERKIASIRGCHSVAVKKLNARIEQVERLKKENAELRQKLRSKL